MPVVPIHASNKYLMNLIIEYVQKFKILTCLRILVLVYLWKKYLIGKYGKKTKSTWC